MAEFGARFRPEQPNCNPKWPRLRRRLCKVPVSTNTPWCWSTEGDDQRAGVRRRGTDSCSGEHQGGRSSKRCAGLASSSVGEIRGEPMAQAGAPFALGPPRTQRSRRRTTVPASPAADPPASGRSESVWGAQGRFGSVDRARRSATAGATSGPRRARCRKTESQIRDPPGTSRTDSESLFPLGLSLSPVQLRADARRPHLRAGHRGRG